MVKEKKTPKIRPEYRVVSSGALDLANFAGEIVSNPDTVLVSLGGELKNYAKLLRDDQVHSLLEQRQDALIAAEWEVVPGGEDSRDREAADFLRGQLMALNWDAITRRMHKGVLYGYSVAECIWGMDGNKITLDAVKIRKPWRTARRSLRRFGFGKDGELKLRVNAQTLLMPERKFWIAVWGADDDDSPYGQGLGHALWWPVYLKRNGAKFWAAYLDKFGSPSVKSKYPAGATEKEKATALEAAKAFRNESAVAVPEGFDVELIEAAKNSGGSYEEFLKYWDGAIAKIILSQTGTTQQGQYSGTAEVLNDVKSELVKADADLLCESFNDTVATWLTEWNFPGAKTPQVWRKVPNTRREEAQRAADKGAYEIGLELTDDAINRRYGEDWKRRAAAPVGLRGGGRKRRPRNREPVRGPAQDHPPQHHRIRNRHHAGGGAQNTHRTLPDARHSRKLHGRLGYDQHDPRRTGRGDQGRGGLRGVLGSDCRTVPRHGYGGTGRSPRGGRIGGQSFRQGFQWLIRKNAPRSNSRGRPSRRRLISFRAKSASPPAPIPISWGPRTARALWSPGR